MRLLSLSPHERTFRKEGNKVYDQRTPTDKLLRLSRPSIQNDVFLKETNLLITNNKRQRLRDSPSQAPYRIEHVGEPIPIALLPTAAFIAGCFFINETGFYWCHRLLH